MLFEIFVCGLWAQGRTNKIKKNIVKHSNNAMFMIKRQLQQCERYTKYSNKKS